MKKVTKTTVKVVKMGCGKEGCAIQPYILPYMIKKAA